MACRQYDFNLKPSQKTIETIYTAIEIIDEYSAQNFDLTLRQLYYQFVARGFIPNKQSEYNKLGDAINTGRLIGMIDWDSIVDRTRFLRDVSTWDNPAEIVEACAEQFKIDRWARQPKRVEVWIEKDALVGVIEGVCEKWRVPYFSCRGYVSQSEMWAAAQRISKAQQKETLILHLGDHDPSGIDMTRDIRERIGMFLEDEVCTFNIERIALNMEQIREVNPPPNPAKSTDSRFIGYIQKHGGSSWELDALEPSYLATLIESKIEKSVDMVKWTEDIDVEFDHRDRLTKVAEKMYEGII